MLYQLSYLALDSQEPADKKPTESDPATEPGRPPAGGLAGLPPGTAARGRRSQSAILVTVSVES